jgi:MFS transporter, FHS family, glucose/mannose:H+ symporter
VPVNSWVSVDEALPGGISRRRKSWGIIRVLARPPSSTSFYCGGSALQRDMAADPHRGDLPHEFAANALIHFGFVVCGVVTILLGPILPILIARWSLSDEKAGLFFTLQFCGNLLGVASLGALLSRRGYGTTLMAGYTSIALGVAGLTFGSERLSLVATIVFGYGLGLVLSGSNLWAAETSVARRAAAISVLNVAWGVGAIACSPVVMFAQRAHRLTPLLLAVAALSAMVAFGVAVMDVEPRAQKLAEAVKTRPTVGKPTALALGGLFFLYVGTENSVGGWGAAFAKRLAPQGGNLWELAPMFFWGGLMAGRAFALVVLSKISEKAFLVAGLIIAGVANGALLWVTGYRVAMACMVVTGVGLACIYPLLVAWLVGYYGTQARRSGNILFALASLGGATMPWLVGFISTHATSLRAGLLASKTCFPA